MSAPCPSSGRDTPGKVSPTSPLSVGPSQGSTLGPDF